MRMLLLIAALAVPLAGSADEAPVLHGADGYAAAPVLVLRTGAPGDLFAAGARVTIDAPTGDDAHVVGFTVTVAAETGGNLYAAGAVLDVTAPVGGDANLVGGSVTVAAPAQVAGNARISGGSIRLEGTVQGDAAVAGGEVTIAGTVAGDLRIAATELTLAEGASVGGALIYTAPEAIRIPPDIADPGRVRHVPAEAGTGWGDAFDWEGIRPSPGPWAVAGGAVVTVAFLVLIGTIFLATLPRQIATMRRMAHDRPGGTMLFGVLGLSALIGLTIVSALSIVGIPFVPIAFLLVVIAWTLGYLLGTYVLAMAVARGLGMGDTPSIWARIGVLALAVGGAALLNFIPVIGWMANLALVFLGIGAFTDAALAAFVPRTSPDTEIDPRKPEPVP